MRRTRVHLRLHDDEVIGVVRGRVFVAGREQPVENQAGLPGNVIREGKRLLVMERNEVVGIFRREDPGIREAGVSAVLRVGHVGGLAEDPLCGIEELDGLRVTGWISIGLEILAQQGAAGGPGAGEADVVDPLIAVVAGNSQRRRAWTVH